MKDFEIRYKKLYKPFSNDLNSPRIFHFLKKILGHDASFLYVAAAYSVIISLLSITVPISVQLLINSVSFTALLQPVITLGIILLVLLIFSGVLYSLQFYTVEIFQRRFITNMSARLCLHLVNADVKALEESNSSELINRFFEVIAVQKSVAKFLTKTLSFLLQAIIGLVLVSFYHPFFLIFSLIVAICLYFIYALYFKKACIAAFYESRRKYDIVGWFEDIVSNISVFKSELGQNYAKFKVNELNERYLDDRKSHFRKLFSQTILLLILYAVASTLLLILGGYLVLKGELTIGQLVAAELILSAVLYAISQFGHDLENIYDLIAACEKLTIFFNIPLQQARENKPKLGSFEEIALENINNKDRDLVIDYNFYYGKKYLVHDRRHKFQEFFIDAMQDFARPQIGQIKVDGKDLYSYDMPSFRNKIAVVDSSPLLEGSLVENLTFNKQNIERGKVNKILKDLGLENIVNSHQEKLDLRVIPSGWPLNQQQGILLKIAKALLLDSKIIIINEVLDIIDYDKRQEILKYISQNSEAMVVYFSNHMDDNVKNFDEILEI